MKLLLIGSEGFIGKHLAKKLQPALITHYKETKHIVDLKNPHLENLPLEGITHAIIAAGCANVKYCEENPNESYLVNVTGPLSLVSQCLERGIFPILFSTDYVFDGKKGNYTENDPTNPINTYGKQKGELEKCLPLITQGNHLVLRLSKIFSTDRGDGSLLDEMVTLLSKGKPLKAATDQIFAPLHIDDLVDMLTLLIKEEAKGLFNVGGKEVISRYDLACKVCRSLKVSEATIKPILLEDLDPTLPRPTTTALSTTKLFKAINYTPLSLDESIQVLYPRNF